MSYEGGRWQYPNHYHVWSKYVLESETEMRRDEAIPLGGSHARLLEDEPAFLPKTRSQSLSNLLATLPTEVVERIPPRILELIYPAALCMIVENYPDVLEYFHRPASIPCFGDDDSTRACPICLDQLRDPGPGAGINPNGQKLPVGALMCGHLFHSMCLQMMMAKSLQPKCPLCTVTVDKWFIFELDPTIGRIRSGIPNVQMDVTYLGSDAWRNSGKRMEFWFSYRCSPSPCKCTSPCPIDHSRYRLEVFEIHFESRGKMESEDL